MIAKRPDIIYRTNAMCLDLKASLEELGEIPPHLRHYLDESDENAVIYHNKGEKKVEKLQELLNDSLETKKLLEGYEDFEEYGLLNRAITNQGILDGYFRFIDEMITSPPRYYLSPLPCHSDFSEG